MDIVVSRRAINQALQKKRSAWIFHPLEGCPPFAFANWWSSRTVPARTSTSSSRRSRRQVARGVGMGRDAVARADRELMHIGLLDCNLVPQEPPEGWFQRRKETDPGKHWRHGYTSWTKYVPRPDCRMSLLTVCCWSLHGPLRPDRMDSPERARRVLPVPCPARRTGERAEGAGDPQGVRTHPAP